MKDAKRQEKKVPQRRKASLRRRWAFRLIAVALSLSPILIGEIICEVAGYGGYPPVLKPMKSYHGAQYIGTFQPGVNTFFWQNLSTTGSMEEHVFRSPKPPGLTRIMTFGGSAMRGFPQPPPLVSTSFLDAMLKDLWPDRRIEVLNFGTTAVASFPVMYILDEALAYEPDLVVIYSGNNEFYGADGVASLHSFGQSTMAMKTIRALRKTGLGQWLSDLITRRQAEAAPNAADGRAKSLMESVIADGQIGPDDSRRTAAAANLRNHLTTMVKACKSHGVPVIICTLPANERDMAPLGKDPEPPIDEAKRRQFDALLAAAEQKLGSDPDITRESLEEAISMFPNHARNHYLLGRCLSALNKDEEALPHYMQAKELDPMPWRAPATLSEVVRSVAAEQDAILCDLEKDFQSASPHGATGWELMDDHVHPTLRGQALIAECILRAMAKLPAPLRVDSSEQMALPNWETYAQKLGANEFDQFGVQHRMRTLFRAPFYAESNPEALARAESRCDEFQKGFTKAEMGAVEYWEKPEAHNAGFRPITGFVGAVLLSEGDFAKADRILCVARRSVPEYSLWNLELTWKALAARRRLRSKPNSDDIALAKEMIEDGETMYHATGIRNPDLCRHLGLAYHLIGDYREAIPDLNTALQTANDMSGFEVVHALVDSLVQTGQRDKAIRVLNSPVKDRNLAQACRSLLNQLDSPE